MNFFIQETNTFRMIWNAPIDYVRSTLIHQGAPLNETWWPCVRTVFAHLSVPNCNNLPQNFSNNVGRALKVLNFSSYKETTYQCPALANLCSSVVDVIKIPCTELARIEQNFKQYISYMKSFEFYSDPTDNTALYIYAGAGVAFVAICVALVVICRSRPGRQASVEANASLRAPLNGSETPSSDLVVAVNSSK